MERQEVFDTIYNEREYQDNAVKKGGTHIVKEFPLGSALTAIRHKLDLAVVKWYGGVSPHQECMDELRKIAAICVQMGEQYGMPERSQGPALSIIPQELLNISLKIKEIVEEYTDIDSTLESTLEGDLGLDSLEMVELLIKIENEFNICITDLEMENWNTIEDVCSSVYNLTNN